MKEQEQLQQALSLLKEARDNLYSMTAPDLLHRIDILLADQPMPPTEQKVDGFTDEQIKKYRDKATLTWGHISDQEMAAMVIWPDRNSLSFQTTVYGARDRIMHLAIENTALKAKLAAMLSAEVDVTKDVDKVLSEAIRTVTGHPDIRSGERSLKAELAPQFVELQVAAREARQASGLNEQYDDVLRSIACHLGAGGFNSDGLIDPKVADAKIRWGIDHIATVERKRGLAGGASSPKS